MTNPASSLHRRHAWRRLVTPAAALALLLAFNWFFSPNFFRIEVRDGRLVGMLIDILRTGAPAILLAIGMTPVIALGGIDLSVGSVVAMAGTLAAVLIAQHEWPFAAALAATLGVCATAGLWNGALVAWGRIQPIVATLVLMVAGRGIAKMFSDGQMVGFQDNAPYIFMAGGHVLGVPFSVLLALAVLLLASAIVRRTSIGLAIEASGDNQRASYLAGVPVRAIQLAAYAFCGLCAGIAGMLAASDTGQADPSRIGLWMELDAIFAVVVGGTALTGGRFTFAGSALGAVLLQTLAFTMYGIGMPPDVAPVPKSLVILAVCLAQSEPLRRQTAAIFRRGPPAKRGG